MSSFYYFYMFKIDLGAQSSSSIIDIRIIAKKVFLHRLEDGSNIASFVYPYLMEIGKGIQKFDPHHASRDAIYIRCERSSSNGYDLYSCIHMNCHISANIFLLFQGNGGQALHRNIRGLHRVMQFQCQNTGCLQRQRQNNNLKCREDYPLYH